jgi:ribosomal protein S15P/S13E
MALILHMLGGAGNVSSSTPTHKKHQRKRLHKDPPQRRSTTSLYSCKEIVDAVQAQSCLILFDKNENVSLIELQGNDNREIPNAKPLIGFLFKQPHSNPSEDPNSNYPSDEMKSEPLKRTRAKTPVSAIGQLERKSMVRPLDRAQTLAEQYQALLPPRAMTPFIFEIPKITPQKLRKIKCELSLRDLIKEHSKRGHSVAYSDADTLIGSESPTALLSPLDGEFEQMKLPMIMTSHKQALSDSVAALDDDIGLKICVDLLTTELATALFRQHPAEREDRASGLQILLMIEAYETVQQHVRQQLCDQHVTEGSKEHVKSVDRILKYWLKVLYTVYDQSQERNFEEKVVEEQWALQDSPPKSTA